MHLFVYGSLLSSVPSSMSKFLRRRGKLVGKATTAGRIFDLGQYPGFVAGGEERVRGELYQLEEEQMTTTLDMLDAYEGVTGEAEDEYRRITIDVRVDDGGEFRAQTYETIRPPAGFEPIARGDYLAFYRQNAAHQRFVNGE